MEYHGPGNLMTRRKPMSETTTRRGPGPAGASAAPLPPGFAALCDGDKLRGFSSRLFGEPAVLFKDKINFKLPGGDGFKPHQDQQAGWSTYADVFLTAMVSIDDTTADNGCLDPAGGQHTG